MEKPLLKIGVAGSVLTAICCFTPALVWLFSLFGLAALTSYLDYVLLPLLILFIILLVLGFMRKDANEQSKT